MSDDNNNNKLAVVRSSVTPDTLFDNPETIDLICTHVANGGSVIEMAKLWNMPYGKITTWLHADKIRNHRYNQAIEDRQEWFREVILRELRCMATSDVRNIYNDEGGLKPVSEWDDSTAACVSNIEVVEEFEGSGKDKVQSGWNKKVKLWSKDKSLELIGKYLQMFNQKIQVDHVMSLADMVNESVDQKVVEPK